MRPTAWRMVTGQIGGSASAEAVIYPAEYRGFTEEGVVLSGTWVQGTAVAPSLLTDQTWSSPHSEILSSVVSALGLI